MPDYRKIAREAARRNGVPESVFVNQIQQESGFNPSARSPVGATGIAQIMPGTARAWKVDPNDPVAALNAAAKNMGRYIKAYGVEGALRAYNAGPGAIEKSKGYRETNDYVKRILTGVPSAERKAMPAGSPGGGLPARTVSTSAVTRATESFDQEGYDTAKRRQMLGSMIAKRNPKSGLLRMGLLSTKEPDRASFITQGEVTTPGQSVTFAGTSSPRGKQSAAAAPSLTTGGRIKVAEMFHDPGISLDNGKKTGSIGGHGTHVHVAVESDRDRELVLRVAKQMGMVITSESDGKHAPGSFHYRKTAKGKSKGVDIGAPGNDPKKLLAFNRRIAAMAR